MGKDVNIFQRIYTNGQYVIKRCYHLVSKKMQTKNKMRYYLSPTKMAIIKNKDKCR